MQQLGVSADSLYSLIVRVAPNTVFACKQSQIGLILDAKSTKSFILIFFWVETEDPVPVNLYRFLAFSVNRHPIPDLSQPEAVSSPTRENIIFYFPTEAKQK